MARGFVGVGSVLGRTAGGRAGATGAADGRRLATIGADGTASCHTIEAGQSSRTWKAMEMANARMRPPGTLTFCKVMGLC
jgi:hypothetical protein